MYYASTGRSGLVPQCTKALTHWGTDPINPGIPSLLRQLNEDEMVTVGQLPKELVILAKYENFGIGTVEKLFEQLKQRVDEKNHEDEIGDYTQESRNGHKKWDSLYVNVKLGEAKTVIRGDSIPSLWKEGLKWIEAHHLPLHQLVKEGIVLGSTDTGKRYASALIPIQKDKRNFTQKHKYESMVTGETYYLETKINPKSGLETLSKLLTRLGVEVKIPLLEEIDQ